MHVTLTLCYVLALFILLLTILISLFMTLLIVLLKMITNNINEQNITKMLDIFGFFIGLFTCFLFMRNYIISISAYFSISWWIVTIISCIWSYYNIYNCLKDISVRLNSR